MRDEVRNATDARRLWDSTTDVTRKRRFIQSFIKEVVVSPHPVGRASTLTRRRGESDVDLTARRREHARETLRQHVTVSWRE